ncbi:uncharacterized protein LOC122576102 isoform X2 [Bombus pyrosoma]|uniref:uncharacterized protein LOC122576102 isoform X2 n=1 Tax=Bombus pyrosoma TaxID=396416 RepID=UPI001CB96456|nr:uncharacterized protein LOC122576102 isoform X2 [Bombus pyrosoma]
MTDCDSSRRSLKGMSNSPDGRQAPPPRLKIQLPIPGQFYPQPGMGYVPTPYGQTPMPMTPVSGQPRVIYANKASEFVFSQFQGIKDLTKSGLSVGEKSAFWLYEKYRGRDDIRHDRGNQRGYGARKHSKGEKQDTDHDSRVVRRPGIGFESRTLEWAGEERTDGIRGTFVRVLQAWINGSRRKGVDLLERCILLRHHLYHHRDAERGWKICATSWLTKMSPGR